MLNNMELHKNFYIRGVLNSLLPEFANPTEGGVLTEKNISGEAIEMMRQFVNDKAPDLQDGQSARIGYFQYSGLEDYDLMRSLGQFMVHKEDGNLILVDKYDFQRGYNEEADDYSTLGAFTEFFKSGDIQPAAQEIGEFLMPEEREDNMRVRIVIPPEPEIQEMLFDEEPEPEATEFVFRGQMTPERYELWKHFSGTV